MARADVPPNWADLPDEQLLDCRLADLPLKLEGTIVEGRLAQLRAELEARNLRFPMHFYISDEWFTPDDTATMAVPFYLTHPRLERLEKSQMLEVEGGEHEWCMRILRHEAGHVIDNVYRLRRRPQRRAVFGSSAVPYPEFYAPRPYSKSFVQHIDPWYAQSHPDEDFAETFAVWLTPESNWERRYAGWAALAKLEYMDALMKSLVGRKPLVVNPEEVDGLRRLRHTLRRHYRRKRRHHGIEHPKFYDRELRRLFSDRPEFANNITAAQFLQKIRQPVRRIVASWTGIYQYTIDKVLEDMITRARELKLRLAVPEEQARYEFTVLLTVQTMNYLHSGRHRVALWKKYRVLVLVHKALVPREDVPESEVNPEMRMEWDVVTTLRARGHDLQVIGVHDDLTPIRKAIEDFKPAIVFNLMEAFADIGVFDQNVVSYLELLRVPYTGCNPRGLTLSRDKALARKLLAYHRIPAPDFTVVPINRKPIVPKRMAYPMIVKSLTYESSIGISQASVVANEEQLIKRVKYIHDTILTPAIVEQFIDGRELYVGVLGNHRLRVLPVWEMSFAKMPDTNWRIATERVKWSVKYQKRHGIDTAEAQLPDGAAARIQHLARRAYRALDLSGYARLDFRMDASGKAYVIEANANPQLAQQEDFAQSARRAQLSYAHLLERIMALGVQWQPHRMGLTE